MSLWTTKADPHAQVFSSLRFDDADLLLRAHEALRQAADDAKAMASPFKTPVRAETLWQLTGPYRPQGYR